MAETNTMDVIFVDYLLPGEPKDAEKHRVPLKEFLALSPEQLTEQNQKIQKALGQLYQLNDREPPLFNSFPKRKTELVINCTPVDGNFTAHYVPDDNKVEIVEEDTESLLLHAFAHELKHAEQFSEELYEIRHETRKDDGLAYHQLRYLEEAQAYAFGNYVSYLAQLNYSLHLDEGVKVALQYKEVSPILEKYTKGNSVEAFPDIECEMMGKILPHLYNIMYHDIFDELKPISDKDKGLTERDIPASFHFKDPKEAFSLLKDMPREARTPAEKIRSMIRYIDKWDKSLFHNKLISSGEILDIIKTEFARSPKDATRRHIAYSEDMLKAFLDFKVDEKSFMQEKDIWDLLDGARASGRKDVEDALLAYKTDHPDDERFAKINFPESEGIKMTALQDEFYAKHPYLKDKKLFANLSDRVINEMNAFEVELNRYILSHTKPNTITNQQRFSWFMKGLSASIEDDAKCAVFGKPEKCTKTLNYIINDDKIFVESLYDAKRLDINPYSGGFFRSDLGIDAEFNNYLRGLEASPSSRGVRSSFWVYQYAPSYKGMDHRFQLAVKPSFELLRDLQEFANKYDCQWKCVKNYNNWKRIDTVDIYTDNPDKEGQKKDLATIVAKHGYDKDHCDSIDRFFDSERIADGAYMSEEYTRADVEKLIERAKGLDEALAKYGESYLEEEPTHPNPMSVGAYETYKTSIDTYEGFVDFIGGLEKAKEPAIKIGEAVRLSPEPGTVPAPMEKGEIERSDDLATLSGKGDLSSKTSRKIVENPFSEEKMSDADLANALATAKDGTYWKFGLTVEQKRREAKKAGEDVPYFIYTDGGEHHEVIPTFTKDYAKEICGKPNTVMFSTLPESTNTSEGNPHAEAPFSKQLNIHIDITEGTGTPEGNKAAYQTAQSLLLAAYDSGVRKFKLESMTPEEIKIWGDVRAALAGQGKSLEFTFADPSSQKVFDSHKAEFAKIEDLNKSIVKDKVAKVKAPEKMEALPPGVRAAIGASGRG